MLIDYGGPGVGNTYFQVTERGVEIAKSMDTRIPEIKGKLESSHLDNPKAPK